MSMRIYNVTVSGRDGGTRVLKVPSKTDVQAGDAAVTKMAPGESILSIAETDDPWQEVDALPAGTQTHPDQPV
jgi:hypothetical protein